ncbi:MAG: exodeoxyribonuclease VII small subunit [Armatimonadetes bacterium]|nr:exodeoxyribonuclease VII small subunit [Armatimonadota bacterium]
MESEFPENAGVKTNGNGKPFAGDAASPAPLPFEEAVAQLEAVVRELEAGEISLEAALARFEEGVRLSRHCIGILDSAQGRIERLTAELNGEPILEPAENEYGA